jgi:hypothetical protein
MTTGQPDFTLSMNGRTLAIDLSTAAQAELAKRSRPLYAQMELYFSCLLRLKVRFYESAPDLEVPWIPVGDKLVVGFRPVMTAQCNNDYQGEEPPLTDFPIAHDAPFTPRWLRIEYRQGQWQGEFGYHQH